MPYDNEYNRKIKREYQDINRRYIEHQKMNDELFLEMPMVSGLANKKFEGGAIPKNLNSDVEFGVNQGSRIVYGDASQYGSNFGEKDAREDKLNYIENLDKEKPMSGGAGFARGTFRDTGFERVLGAGKTKGVKAYKKTPLKLTKVMGAGKRRGRPSKMASKMVGGTELGLPQKLVEAVPKIPKVPKVKKEKEVKKIEKIINNIKKEAKKEKEDKEEKEEAEKKKEDKEDKEITGKGKHKKQMKGKGFLSGLWKGIKTVAKPLASVAKVGLSLTPLPQAQLAATALDALGAGKRRGRPSKMKGGNLVPVANMKSSSMAGQGKPSKNKPIKDKPIKDKPKNKRAEIVKKIMKEKSLSMIDASKYVKEHNLYVK
jgi:hypothetical protein